MRFRDRLLIVLLLLLASVLGANYLVVRQANLAQAQRNIHDDLRVGALIFEEVLKGRLAQLSQGARLMSDDWAFRRLFGETTDFQDPLQHRTLVSGLYNYAHRLRHADFLLLVSLEGKVLADTAHPETASLPDFAFASLLASADESEDFSATEFALFDGRPSLLLAVPILIPEPEGWIVVGFAVDDALAEQFKRLSGLEVSFAHLAQGDWKLSASTHTSEYRRLLADSLSGEASHDVFRIGVRGSTWVSLWHEVGGDSRMRCLLQRDLHRELQPYRRLERTLLLLTACALVLSAGAAAWLAAGISRPVSDLTLGASRIERGIYREPVPVHGSDELGKLATAFNKMALGLEERDRVRDLLGKAVSPEIATELLRRPPALGGEEREVTVLFTDLRGFTSLSESVSPTELVTVLNAYFTLITGVIESHGGIVDKYIGDAVMAVFGAPLDRADHAARGVACAHALYAALEQWNAGRTAKGFSPLHTPMGLATGIVVAGNIGSESRHNYTVMGDAANLAARLQDLTKEQGVSCLVSAETAEAARRAGYAFRAMGTLAVRGRSEPMAVFTLAPGPCPATPV